VFFLPINLGFIDCPSSNLSPLSATILHFKTNMAPKASEEKQRQQQIASAQAALQRLQKMSRPLPTIQESALLSRLQQQ
jgi:hypothetical protein